MLLELPIIKGDAVAQAKPCQKIIAEKLSSARQIALPNCLLKSGNITPNGVGFQADYFAVGKNRFCADGRFEGGKCAAQGGFGPAVVGVRPQKCG